MPKAVAAKLALPGGQRKRTTRAPEKAQRAPPKSAEFVISSDSDSGRSGKSSDSESDPTERRDTKRPAPDATKHAAPKDPPGTIDIESGSGSETSSNSGSSGSSSGSSDVESEEENGPSATKAVDKAKEKSAAPPSNTKGVRPRKPYEPPHGFQPFNSSGSSSPTSSLFKSENLKGKEIWHITAPSSVPLESIKEVALDALAKEKPILQHQGVEYALSEPTSEEVRKLKTMVPHESGAGYSNVSIPISRSLHLQQVLRLPSITKDNPGSRHPSGAASVQTPAVKQARPQPKGLKMRYLPSGFGDGKPGTIGSSSSEELDDHEQPHAGDSTNQSAVGRPEKRKLDEASNLNEDHLKPSNKRRKHNRVSTDAPQGQSDEIVGTINKPSHVNGVTNPNSKEAATTTRKSNHNEFNFTDGPDDHQRKGAEVRKESREDKERRRKERRERKGKKMKREEG